MAKIIGKITLGVNYANVLYNGNANLGTQYGWNTGGITGNMKGEEAEVIKCINYGNVIGTHNVGGIVANFGAGTISLCANYGYIKGETSGLSNVTVGGVIGNIFVNNDSGASKVTIDNSYNVGTIENMGSMERGNIGGICSYARK